MKTKKIKLNKDTKLVVLNDEGKKVAIRVETKDNKTAEVCNIFVNKCDTCGEIFFTKFYPTSTCEKCEKEKNEFAKNSIKVLDDKLSGLKTLFSFLEIFGDDKKENKECKREKDNDTENGKRTYQRKKYTFKYEFPQSRKYEKYINEHKGNLVVPKNIDTLALPKQVNKLMVECLFDCVYKGKSISAMASIFKIKQASIIKYLSNMSSKRLIYPAGDGLRYKVMPDVEVKTI